MPALPASRARMPDLSNVDFGDAAQTKAYMQSLLAALTHAFEQRAPVNTALPSRLMLAPDGSTYRMTIDDAGTVVTEKVGTESS